jgi:hypothetical protein
MKIARSFSAILCAVLIYTSLFTGCIKKSNSDTTDVSTESADSIPETTAYVAFNAARYNVGGIIYFGTYEQDNNIENGKEKIAWLVLKVERNRALLISEKILDCKPFIKEGIYPLWVDSDIRLWLNSYYGFLFDSFTSEERDQVEETLVLNHYSLDLENRDQDQDTRDYVFLLSKSETIEYLKDISVKTARGTDYAKSNGLYADTQGEYAGNCAWWLRSLGPTLDEVDYVGFDGLFGHLPGNNPKVMGIGVRPALWVSRQADVTTAKVESKTNTD